MTQAQMFRRQKAVSAALGSVRAEGLQPSAKTQRMAQEYAKGKITISELRAATIQNVKNKFK